MSAVIWRLGFATDDKRLRQTSAASSPSATVKAGDFPTRYWTPELHVGAFALPRFIAETLGRARGDARLMFR